MTLSPNKKRRSLFTQQAEPMRMQLRMVPMIDVVFLLLIFFLLAANFRSKEGFLPAHLPQEVTHSQITELEPLSLKLDSLPDDSCLVQIGGTESFIIGPATEPAPTDFSLLGRQLKTVLAEQGRRLDDPIKLLPTPTTKWDHVVKAYDVLWRTGLDNIIFTIVE